MVEGAGAVRNDSLRRAEIRQVDNGIFSAKSALPSANNCENPFASFKKYVVIYYVKRIIITSPHPQHVA
jgi:hypothetical protein